MKDLKNKVINYINFIEDYSNIDRKYLFILFILFILFSTGIMGNQVAFFSTAIGAGFGVIFPFYLERTINKNDKFEHELRSLKETAFALNSQLNLLNMVNGVISPYENNRGKLGYIECSLNYLHMNTDSLLYILDTEEPNLLSEIELLEKQMVTFVNVFKFRNESYRALQHNNCTNKDATEQEVYDLTNEMYNLITDLIESNIKLDTKMHKFFYQYKELKKFANKNKNIFLNKKYIDNEPYLFNGKKYNNPFWSIKRNL